MSALALAADLLTLQAHDQQLLQIGREIASMPAPPPWRHGLQHAKRMNDKARAMLSRNLIGMPAANDGAPMPAEA